MNNLASVLKYQDNASEEATLLLRHVYEARSKIYGPDSEVARRSMWSLPHHLRGSGQNGEQSEVLDRQKMGLDETVNDRNPDPSPQPDPPVD